MRTDPRSLARTAHSHAIRCAQSITNETDEAVKAYLRHLAISWNQLAEQQDFLVAMEEAQRAEIHRDRPL
jgi:predicted protein tyrosine phosphatase